MGGFLLVESRAVKAARRPSRSDHMFGTAGSGRGSLFYHGGVHCVGSVHCIGALSTFSRERGQMYGHGTKKWSPGGTRGYLPQQQCIRYLSGRWHRVLGKTDEETSGVYGG